MLSRVFSFIRPRTVSRSYLIDKVIDDEHRRRESEADLPRNPDEIEYLMLMLRIMKYGSLEKTRTGVPAKTLFGEMLSFDLRGNQLPLLTTKFVSMRNVLRELLWFISGSTNLKDLERFGVFIWHENASDPYLESIGLRHRYEPYTDLGPIYSHQWRHYGAPYVDCYTNYQGKGVDQLKEVLRMLRHDRTSRRNILLAWNPTQMGECVLPPCHCMAQFRVLRGKELHCHLTQRSGDYALGVPYNIASYATLTHILAKLSGLQATRLTISFGDVHIYQTHLDLCAVQIGRTPLLPPKLHIDLPDYDPNFPLDFSSLAFERFKLENYRHLPRLDYQMCV